MGVMGCPKTLVRNYHSMLHNIPEEHRSHRMWQCRPWFSSAWSSSEWSSLAWYSSTPHMQIWDDLTYLTAKFQGQTASCIWVNVSMTMKDKTSTWQPVTNNITGHIVLQACMADIALVDMLELSIFHAVVMCFKLSDDHCWCWTHFLVLVSSYSGSHIHRW